MMKKLSATFKRTKSTLSHASSSTVHDDVSPNTNTHSTTTEDTLAQLTNAYQRVLQEQNRQVQELERLRSMTSNPSTNSTALPSAVSGKPPKAPAPRAKTFNNGNNYTTTPLLMLPANKRASDAENVIPFFQQNNNTNINNINNTINAAPAQDGSIGINIPPKVLTVPGTPVWQAKKLKNKHKQRQARKKYNGGNAMQYFNSNLLGSALPPNMHGNPHISRPKPSRRQVTAPSYEPTGSGYVLEYDRVPSRNRQRSFSIGEAAAQDTTNTTYSSGSEGGGRSSLENPRYNYKNTTSNRGGLSTRVLRLASGKRWKTPRTTVEGVAVKFNSLPGSSRDTILQRRDRNEALPLASACAHLEAEIYRLRDTCGDINCNNKDDDKCECPHRRANAEAVDRLTDVLVILEDRFDTIEQFYVKGKEYARAMGKFYNVSPNEYSKWVEQRSGAPKTNRAR